MLKIFQRLFSQPREEVDPAQSSHSIPQEEEQPQGLEQLPPGLHVGKLSDIGKERERNEDSLYVIESTLYENDKAEPFGLFIVADGMGGHQRGEVASSLAARTTAAYILQNIYLADLAPLPDSSDNRTISEILEAAVSHANESVQEVVDDGGTTLTAALVIGNNAYIAHIGDSRAYLYHNQTVKQITTDHSLAKHLQDIGQATAEEVAHVQNVLYRAIGQGASIEVDTHMQHLPAGSSLLLCSDGLWGLIPHDLLREVISTASDPQEACERLVLAANDYGGRDNITVILVSVGAEPKSQELSTMVANVPSA